MKLISISGVTYYVKDIDTTVKFYEDLGFIFKVHEPGHATMYLNWYFVDFFADMADRPAAQKTQADSRGAGTYMYTKVDTVDEYYEALVAKGLKPETEPEKLSNGNREFLIRDPDGYGLVFFEK
jgi:catechol 2,3-dioxygenase-like lactoylglutathione lyase family enzyme